MAAGSTYTPIATTTLGSAQATITFSSISGSYTDLICVMAGAGSTTTNLRFSVGNGSIDTGSNYSETDLYGDGTNAASYNRQDNKVFPFQVINTGTGQINMIAQFMNYANTNVYKTFLIRGSSASNGAWASVNLWRSTSAINIIEITRGSGDFNSGSTFTLYGITAA